LVRDPVLEKLHQPFVVDGVEEPLNVCIEHPVHLFPQDADYQRIQCLKREIMLVCGPSQSIVIQGSPESSQLAMQRHHLGAVPKCIQIVGAHACIMRRRSGRCSA